MDDSRLQWLITTLMNGDVFSGPKYPFNAADFGTTKFSPTRAADKFRENAWGKPIFGVTYPSPVDLFPVVVDVENTNTEVLEGAFVL